jgi:beta-lactamase regulating signal transducer with metallopeptidase domain
MMAANATAKMTVRTLTRMRVLRHHQGDKVCVALRYKSVMSVMVIVLSLGLFGIVVGAAYWLAREEQKTIKRIPPEEMDEKERQARREAAANIGNFPPS